MRLTNVSIKRFMVSGLTAAAMMLPFTLPSAALASRGSRDVRGNLPTQAQQVLQNETWDHHAPTLAYQRFQAPVQQQNTPNTDHLSLAERAINTTLNPRKPINID